MANFSTVMIEAALHVAKTVKARALMLYVDAVDRTEPLSGISKSALKLILIVRRQKDAERARQLTDKVLSVPDFSLTRMGQIKMATLMAFSQRMLEPGDTFVFLTGVVGEPLDTLVVMSVGKEYEIFQSVDQPPIREHIRRVVFQRVLSIALELANEGREGRPVGALFVVGNYRELAKYCQQDIINPFRGYTEKERNVLDDSIKETVKGFSTLDGAFVVKGNGVIVSAATTLRSGLAGAPLPQGLGARHAAAASITASTKSIAVTVSESTGTVRVWRLGQMITEIEKAPRPAGPPASPVTEPAPS